MNHLYTSYSNIWRAQNNDMNTLFNYLKGYQTDMDDFGNITVKNTSEKKVPGFCCHLDTVHKEPPLPILANGVLFDGSGNGIGGDDKCGIIACLELLQNTPCKCIFFVEEEKGGTGSRVYDQKNLSDCSFLIEIDRKGSEDLIFVSGTEKLCSKEFQTTVENHFVGFKKAQGTFTDVNVLDETKLNMMNISCGYYLPHTNSEYVLLEHLQNTISLLKSFAELNLDFKPYKRPANQYIQTEQLWGGYDGYGNYSLRSETK